MPTREDVQAEFSAFVEENRAALSWYGYLLTGRASSVDDLVQEALVKTYLNWGRIAPGRALAFTRKVMANQCTDWWRRRRFESPDEAPERAAASGQRGYEAVEARDDIARQLAALTPRERAVVVLRFYADLSEADVARDLGVSVGTVKSTCSRALARMRRNLTGPPVNGAWSTA